MFRKLLFISLTLTLAAGMFTCADAMDLFSRKNNTVPYIKLNNGVKMPGFGLGTFMLMTMTGKPIMQY